MAINLQSIVSQFGHFVPKRARLLVFENKGRKSLAVTPETYILLFFILVFGQLSMVVSAKRERSPVLPITLHSGKRETKWGRGPKKRTLGLLCLVSCVIGRSFNTLNHFCYTLGGHLLLTFYNESIGGSICEGYT